MGFNCGIVGLPNVGKSTLFNALAGEMISIVKDTPGVTRDRIYANIDWTGHQFTMIDTGGIEPDSNDIILKQMREQAQIAIDTADVIIFMTDIKQGLVDADSKVADMLRRSGKPIVLVVNKVDNFQKMEADVYEFYNLGIGDPIAVSAANRLGLGELLDCVVDHFPPVSDDEAEDEHVLTLPGHAVLFAAHLITVIAAGGTVLNRQIESVAEMHQHQKRYSQRTDDGVPVSAEQTADCVVSLFAEHQREVHTTMKKHEQHKCRSTEGHNELTPYR
jgi:small GTP-binding protein